MQTVVDYFDQVASSWDEMRRRYFSNHIAQEMVREAALTTDMVAADIGTGTGFVALAAASQARHVFGIDASGEMLLCAQQKSAKNGISNITFLQGDAEALPLADHTADVVMTNMMLHHVERPERVIGEMARILKESGKLVVSDVDYHGLEWAHEQMADVWLGFAREQILTWLAGAGLRQLEIRGSGYQCHGQSPTGEQVVVDTFIATGVKKKI